LEKYIFAASSDAQIPNWKGFLNERICGVSKLLHKGRLAVPALAASAKKQERRRVASIKNMKQRQLASQEKIVSDFIQEPEARAG
jgi:hypothetical protein